MSGKKQTEGPKGGAAQADGENARAAHGADAGASRHARVEAGQAASVEPEAKASQDAHADPHEHTPAGAPTGRAAIGVALVALLALVFGVVATAVSGFLWWQYRQFYVALDEADAESRRGLEDIRARARRIEDSLESARADGAANRRELDTLEQELELVPPRLAALDQRIDALQGGSLDARSEWLEAEAEYYLATANAELNIAGRWQGAMTALELADRLLIELGDPALAPVRAAIAGELLALGSVRVPDTQGLAFSLARLAERVPELPLRADPAGSFASDEAALDDAEPGLGRLWLGVRQALSGIVRVERRDESVRPALSDAERRLVRRQLVVELELARVALLRGEQDGFGASLSVAADLLRREFDIDAPTVAGALDLVTGMAGTDIAPDLPDISTSLNRLRAAGSGDD